MFRQQEIVKTLMTPGAFELYEGRPVTNPYCVAMLFAHINAIFHVDEEKPPPLKGYEMHILTTTDKPQATSKQQRFAPIEQKFLGVKCKKLEGQEIIELSESAYRAPLMLVQYVDRVKDFMKRFGDKAIEAMDNPEYADLVAAFYRLTVDLRLLNALTVPDRQPMPRISDVLDSFAGDQFFSCFDIKDAFWTVLLALSDRHKTAFATHNTLYQWCRMPQGSRAGANTWARIIQSCLEDRPSTVAPF